jgi:hypothetical protein
LPYWFRLKLARSFGMVFSFFLGVFLYHNRCRFELSRGLAFDYSPSLTNCAQPPA